MSTQIDDLMHSKEYWDQMSRLMEVTVRACQKSMEDSIIKLQTNMSHLQAEVEELKKETTAKADMDSRCAGQPDETGRNRRFLFRKEMRRYINSVVQIQGLMEEEIEDLDKRVEALEAAQANQPQLKLPPRS